MKKIITGWLSAVCILMSGALCAQNLVKNNDFNAYKDKTGPEFRSNGGKFTLFTEDRTWNRCGKLEVPKLSTKNGISTASANVWAGGKYESNDKPGGFVCKPGTTYEFSVDIKGTAQRAGIHFTQWNAKQTLWHGKNTRLIGGFKVNDKWTNYKGSFTTAPDAVNAALSISLWDQAKTERLKTKVGDYLLIDNLVIRERKRPALNKADGSAAKVSLDIRKIIPADGTVYSDFHRFRKDGDLTAKTSFKVERAADALVITINCEEPVKITPAKGDNGQVWSGDVVELFFGAQKADRDFSQFVVSANGKTYTSMVNGENLKWDVKTEIKTKAGVQSPAYRTRRWAGTNPLTAKIYFSIWRVSGWRQKSMHRGVRLQWVFLNSNISARSIWANFLPVLTARRLNAPKHRRSLMHCRQNSISSGQQSSSAHRSI